jgi:hypothetical protein
MRVVQFQTVIFGDMRCSLRYDLAFPIVRFVLITYIFSERTAVEVFRLLFQIPGWFRSTGRWLWHCTGQWQCGLC